MDELTLLRSTRDDTREPSGNALATGRAALLRQAAAPNARTSYVRHLPRGRKRVLPRLTWAAAGVAVALTGALVVGNVSLSTQSAYASDILRTASAQIAEYADLVPGPGEYLSSHTHGRWQECTNTATEPKLVCNPYEEILDVYMPADVDAEWVLFRDWGDVPDASGKSNETIRAADGQFYRDAPSWLPVDLSDIPTDGAAAYEWVDLQYDGGSASRDEDNFVRIVEILGTGLVPGPQRAALLDALSRIPGISATDDVANLDGVTGVAIGRDEPVRAGERQEIIIDPNTGMVIGQRTVSGATAFGWGTNKVVTLTAIETTVVKDAP